MHIHQGQAQKAKWIIISSPHRGSVVALRNVENTPEYLFTHTNSVKTKDKAPLIEKERVVKSEKIKEI